MAGSIVDVNGRMTGAQLRAAIDRRKSELAAEGCGEGALVALVLPNEAAFFVNLFAVWELGGCALPISPFATASEILAILRDARPCLVVRREETRSLEGSAPAPGTALLLYTSGTTSRPKGVMISHAALRAKLATLERVQGVDVLARTLCLLPVSFGHGLIGNSLPTLLAGGELHLPLASVTQDLGRYLDENAITFFSSVPAQWASVLPFAAPPTGGHLRRVFCASAGLPVGRWGEAARWLGGDVDFRNVYGITEAASWISALPEGAPYLESGAVGQGWDCELAIDPASGEVLVRAPYLMTGYRHDPEATAAALAGGWLRTGDSGALDAAGSLRLTGRLKDQINRGGQKVSPAEVEESLLRHPAVADCCVFGVGDDIAGESVAAAIVSRGTPPSGSDLRSFLRQHLGEHKIPEKFHFLAEIPRNARGKVSRAEVAASCGKAR